LGEAGKKERMPPPLLGDGVVLLLVLTFLGDGVVLLVTMVALLLELLELWEEDEALLARSTPSNNVNAS